MQTAVPGWKVEGLLDVTLERVVVLTQLAHQIHDVFGKNGGRFQSRDVCILHVSISTRQDQHRRGCISPNAWWWTKWRLSGTAYTARCTASLGESWNEQHYFILTLAPRKKLGITGTRVIDEIRAIGYHSQLNFGLF